jgi:hypothetical protein
MPNNRFLYQAVEKMLLLLDSRFRSHFVALFDLTR